MMNNEDKDLIQNQEVEDRIETEDLDKMIDLAKEDIHLETKSKFPKKIVILIGAAMTLLIASLIISKLIIKPQEFEDKTKTPPTVEEQINSANKSEWDFKYPAEVPEWSKKVFNDSIILERDKTYDSLMEFSKEQTNFLLFTSIVASEEGGNWLDAPPVYTNDTTQRKKPNGEENELFSYTLKEDYLIAYSSYIQKLINPVFGNWVFAQRYTPNKPLKDNKDLNVLKPMFAEEWWKTNIKEGQDYTSLPILVDWDGDDFGGLKFAERVDGQYGTWYGVVIADEENPVTAENLGRDERNQHVIKVTTPIKYSAFGENNQIINKIGILELTLQSNSVEHMINRVVISDARLILE